MLWREITGGITAPKGFVAGGVYCGIRKVKKDIAIIRSESPAVVAGVFTLNKTQAAPVTVCKEQLRRSRTCSAVVVNSGNANACTGERGMLDARRMVSETAAALGLPEETVMVSSTGVIGQFMPMDKISAGISQLSGQLATDGSGDAAEAILTTDTFKKEIAAQCEVGGVLVTIGGIAKGSGMIAPNMATMLAFVTTDAVIDADLLQTALRDANKRSFNRITVDGDMSTNDMLLILANGRAGNPPITAGGEDYERFYQTLEFVLISLAKMIARDGEGATKLIQINVTGAHTEEEAAQAARSIANSNLVKTALHGADANWGRILAAVGYSGIDFDPDNVEVWFSDLPVLGKNYDIVLDEAKAKALLEQKEIYMTVNLNQGDAAARFWTCDLTKEYVHINASYRS